MTSSFSFERSCVWMSNAAVEAIERECARWLRRTGDAELRALADFLEEQAENRAYYGFDFADPPFDRIENRRAFAIALRELAFESVGIVVSGRPPEPGLAWLPEVAPRYQAKWFANLTRAYGVVRDATPDAEPLVLDIGPELEAAIEADILGAAIAQRPSAEVELTMRRRQLALARSAPRYFDGGMCDALETELVALERGVGSEER